jgi:hypothetical protein
MGFRRSRLKLREFQNASLRLSSHKESQTIVELAMISDLLEEAYDFLARAAGATDFKDQEHIAQTPLSRDGLLL